MRGRMSATAHIVAELERADLLVTAMQFGGNDVTTFARRCQSLKAFMCWRGKPALRQAVSRMY